MTTTRRAPDHRTRNRYVNGPDENDQPGKGCRCTPCRQANTADANNVYRLKAYGRYQPYTDAEPVRRHIQALIARGIKPKRIAELSGVSHPTVVSAAKGTTRRVRTKTAKAILAVRPSTDLLKDRARIDATGTRRRLQALIAMGWSRVQLAERAGINRRNLPLIVHADSVRADTARKIADLYDRLWIQEPPAATPRQRRAVADARAEAAANGWPSPLAWNDDQIDNPKARPRGIDRSEEVA